MLDHYQSKTLETSVYCNKDCTIEHSCLVCGCGICGCGAQLAKNVTLARHQETDVCHIIFNFLVWLSSSGHLYGYPYVAEFLMVGSRLELHTSIDDVYCWHSPGVAQG